MKTVGIICEYNPFHLGHAKQIRYLKDTYPDCAVVCLMSGNYVQRGHPAIFDKTSRAAAALDAGADLVLEMPIHYALSSAEGFAQGGVSILGKFCDGLCFGCESGDEKGLMETAQALLSPEFPQKLRLELDKGLSFPAARQAALGERGELLENPNDILAVEYCKAILALESPMKPLPISRPGSYHADAPDPEDPSATAVRKQILTGGDWERYVPAPQFFREAPRHCLKTGEQGILYRLRSMTDGEFEALPYGSEGLWRKLMHASREEGDLEAVIAATKSKRYTRSRIDRMILCAYLGITGEILREPAPYVRVLGFSDMGRTVLKKAKQTGIFPNIGEKMLHPYQMLERRSDDLYGLFADPPEPPGRTQRQRVTYREE